jgi:hypothetical protein
VEVETALTNRTQHIIGEPLVECRAADAEALDNFGNHQVPTTHTDHPCVSLPRKADAIVQIGFVFTSGNKHHGT